MIEKQSSNNEHTTQLNADETFVAAICLLFYMVIFGGIGYLIMGLFGFAK